MVIFILLQVTYRKRLPLKRRLSRARNSFRRNSTSGTSGAAPAPQQQNRGGRGRRRRDQGRRQLSPGASISYMYMLRNYKSRGGFNVYMYVHLVSLGCSCVNYICEFGLALVPRPSLLCVIVCIFKCFPPPHNPNVHNYA